MMTKEDKGNRVCLFGNKLQEKCLKEIPVCVESVDSIV